MQPSVSKDMLVKGQICCQDLQIKNIVLKEEAKLSASLMPIFLTSWNIVTETSEKNDWKIPFHNAITAYSRDFIINLITSFIISITYL